MGHTATFVQYDDGQDASAECDGGAFRGSPFEFETTAPRELAFEPDQITLTMGETLILESSTIE